MSKQQTLLETLKVDWTKCRAHGEQKHTLIEVGLFQFHMEMHE